MTATPHQREHASITPVTMFPGVVRRTLVSGERQTLVEIALDAGAEVPEHTHPHEQAGQVQTGRVMLRLGDGPEREVGPGGAYLIPGGLPHFVRALEASRLVEAFAPVRDEFVDYEPAAG
jgi:quercetin dioxygenase-like cupin family protein